MGGTREWVVIYKKRRCFCDDLGGFSMQKNELIFNINQCEKLCIVLSRELGVLSCYDYIKVVYFKNNICEHVIYDIGTLYAFINGLDKALRAVVSERFRIGRWLQINRVYGWSAYRTVFTARHESGPMPDFIGQKYILSKTKTVVAYVYENRREFFFEIAAVYRFRRIHSQSDEKIDEQKNIVYATTRLGIETIYAWLERIKHVRALIEFNTSEHFADSEAQSRGYSLSIEVRKKKDIVEKKRVKFQHFMFFNHTDEDEEDDF